MNIKAINLLFILCAIMIGVHVANQFLNGWFYQFSLLPREVHSLPYIFTSPFLHGSWQHLMNNLVGFVIFSGLCLLRGVNFYVRSSVFIITLTGLLVWAFGRANYHVGASGWIFGLWSLSIAIAWFDRKFLNIVIALFVAIFYGGMIFGVVPFDRRISFESHLFGMFAGIACAYVMTRKRRYRVK